MAFGIYHRCPPCKDCVAFFEVHLELNYTPGFLNMEHQRAHQRRMSNLAQQSLPITALLWDKLAPAAICRWSSIVAMVIMPRRWATTAPESISCGQTLASDHSSIRKPHLGHYPVLGSCLRPDVIILASFLDLLPGVKSCRGACDATLLSRSKWRPGCCRVERWFRSGMKRTFGIPNILVFGYRLHSQLPKSTRFSKGPESNY